jgi:hypothetical protein
MAGVFEITDRTILKILVRRGLDVERSQVRFDEGELAYTIDTKRLFIGDGLGGGGNVAGNLFHGAFPDVDTVIQNTPGIQYGDTLYDTTESTLYAISEDTSQKFDIGPRYEDLVLEKTSSPTGRVRISERVFGKTTTGITDYRKAFFFGYDDVEPFYGTNKILELNSNYWSLTSKSGFNPANSDGMFYFGNITGNIPGTKYDLNYRININTAGLNGALKVYGSGDDTFAIGDGGEIGNVTGRTYIIGASGISFIPGGITKYGASALYLSPSGTAYFQKTGGSPSQPAFLVDGFSKFANSVMINNDLLVVGNLTALGDFTVLDTYVTASSALSVINATPMNALTVEQRNTTNRTAVFQNTNKPTNRVIIDKVCNASFGIGFGLDDRDSAISLTESLSSIHVAGGIFVRDVNTSNLGMLDVNVRGRAIMQTSYNFIDGKDYGTFISRGLVEQNAAAGAYLPTDLALMVHNPIGAGAKVMCNTAFGPAIVAATSRTSSLNSERLFSGRFAAGNNFVNASTDGTETSYIASDGTFVFGNPAVTTIVGTVNGQLNVTGDVIAFSSSDEQLKNNIEVIPSALEKINKIRGVKFEWKPESNFEGKDVGVIAQEIEKVLPEVVATRLDGYKAVRYEKLVPLLIEGIKELYKLVEEKK